MMGQHLLWRLQRLKDNEVGVDGTKRGLRVCPEVQLKLFARNQSLILFLWRLGKENHVYRDPLAIAGVTGVTFCLLSCVSRRPRLN